MTNTILSREVKDAQEVNYWAGVDKNPDIKKRHLDKLQLYLWAFGNFEPPKTALEIGPGPYGGVLPLLHRLQHGTGIEPNYSAYVKRGIGTIRQLEQESDGRLVYISTHFEDWNSLYQPMLYDAVFAMDSLDHGEMGWDVLPKIASLLLPGGRFYLHVNLRPPEKLNELHDHSLSLDGFMLAVTGCGLSILKWNVHPHDIDGSFDCPTLVAVMEKVR